MSQLVAVLKDSYREAVSTWVVPLMLGAAALLTLFVASVSFRPTTLKDGVERTFAAFNWTFQFDPTAKGPAFAVENDGATNPDEPWNSDYQFDLVFRTPKPDLLKQMRTNVNLPLTKNRAVLFVKREFPQLAKVTAEDISPPAGPPPVPGVGEPAPVEVRIRVRTEGTTTKDPLAWLHIPRALFAFDIPVPTTLRQGVYTLEKRLVNDAMAWVLLLVGVVATAGFVPDLLRKGALDLTISKPISRTKLLTYKYLGGLILVLLLASAVVGGAYLAVGLRTGLWAPQILLLVPVLTFTFAVLYSVSVLAAVLTRSGLVAILATLLAWALFFGAGWGREKLDDIDRAQQKLIAQAQEAAKPAGDEPDAPAPPKPDKLWSPPAALDWTVRGLYAVLPRVYDLDSRMIDAIADGVLTPSQREAEGRPAAPSWGETLGVSAAFIALMLGLAAWRLGRRDG